MKPMMPNIPLLRNDNHADMQEDIELVSQFLAHYGEQEDSSAFVLLTQGDGLAVFAHGATHTVIANLAGELADLVTENTDSALAARTLAEAVTQIITQRVKEVTAERMAETPRMTVVGSVETAEGDHDE